MNSKKILLAAIAATLALGGCKSGTDEPAPLEGQADVAAFTPSPLEGPGGGEVQDQTSPVAPASATGGGDVSSAFPPGVPPSTEPIKPVEVN